MFFPNSLLFSLVLDRSSFDTIHLNNHNACIRATVISCQLESVLITHFRVTAAKLVYDTISKIQALW